LMGSNMMRQAVPLLKPESPLSWNRYWKWCCFRFWCYYCCKKRWYSRQNWR
jgi:hypothetical protein